MDIEKETLVYRQLVTDAVNRVRQGQIKALKAVNQEQIQLYWDLGKMIVERQELYKWGKSVVENLATDLQKEFQGMMGMSAANLWRMRAFYLAYYQNIILAPLVREIGWSHNFIIFEKCKDETERLFYINQVKNFGWSKNVLIHKIGLQTYQKVILSQQNFDKTLPDSINKQAALAVKDEYTFDFLELADEHSEYELEQALINDIRKFLIEMGGDFSFIGNQFVIDLEGKDYKIDILLYHRGIQSLIAIDLKIDEFKPEYAGKMNFYLSLLNNKIKKPYENSSIGIIICKSKSRTTVDFALQDVNKPIGVATYSLTKTLPNELKDFFPSNEELIKKIESFSNALQQK